MNHSQAISRNSRKYETADFNIVDIIQNDLMIQMMST